MTSTKQPNCILYRVIADYTPSEAYKASGCLVIKRGEILEVESPVQLEDGTEQQPKGNFVDELSCMACMT